MSNTTRTVAIATCTACSAALARFAITDPFYGFVSLFLFSSGASFVGAWSQPIFDISKQAALYTAVFIAIGVIRAACFGDFPFGGQIPLSDENLLAYGSLIFLSYVLFWGLAGWVASSAYTRSVKSSGARS